MEVKVQTFLKLSYQISFLTNLQVDVPSTEHYWVVQIAEVQASRHFLTVDSLKTIQVLMVFHRFVKARTQVEIADCLVRQQGIHSLQVAGYSNRPSP